MIKCCLFLLCCLGCITCSSPKKMAGIAAAYRLVWSDEFNYTGLPDLAKWSYDIGGNGWGNDEAEFYTGKRMENARVENGHLIIEARKEALSGVEGMEGKSYTSARLVTKNKGDWQYGKLEVRAKIPRGRGSWPAIWMLGSKDNYNWPDDGEIDIMEHVGFDQGKIHASVHCKKYYHSIGTQKTAITTVADCSENYHVYSLTWNAEMVQVAVDGKNYFSFANEHSGYDAWPFDNKMHLLLNIAIGGGWGGQKGIDDSIFPIQMEVDYVRMYEEKQ